MFLFAWEGKTYRLNGGTIHIKWGCLGPPISKNGNPFNSDGLDFLSHLFSQESEELIGPDPYGLDDFRGGLCETAFRCTCFDCVGSLRHCGNAGSLIVRIICWAHLWPKDAHY